MREFKFRAWDVINKKMYPVAFPTWNGAVDGKIDFVNHVVEVIDEDGDDKPILMQFTGLCDKNGKEIYEGDICSMIFFMGGDEYGASEVFFDAGAFSLKCGRHCHPCLYEADPRYIEVIGNIYEHPELLK